MYSQFEIVVVEKRQPWKEYLAKASLPEVKLQPAVSKKFNTSEYESESDSETQDDQIKMFKKDKDIRMFEELDDKA